MKISRSKTAVMALLSAVTLLSLWGSCVGASTVNAKPSGIKWSDLERKYEGVFVLSASRGSRKVALTFDDVPDPRFTPQVLNVLRDKKVHATFFVVGTRSSKHPDLVKRIHREGHDIGNHSYSHPNFSKLPLAKVQEQIGRAERKIESIVGFKPRLVRPPYGEILPAHLEWAKKKGYTVVNWDVDSSDWRQLNADKVFRNVTQSVRPGSVVLMHAGGGKGQNLSGTVKALPRIIDWLRAHQYEPVTLTDLLEIPEQRTGK
ncbi:polysaccharide deacetylase family protein [Cohnella cholangitidis]|uniref:Polysaccharide deacetylase family protein n=1 Tax=Cohnella cholangitidis TaxID=2598458 RepID=A0A7G5BV76_9BACL|nr:polysaccharide deacetylase family protein [Cohnella cholangitidis]QMV40860.1 polysaccharide deacetylase family protein [Cohnella cholangitidis]